MTTPNDSKPDPFSDAYATARTRYVIASALLLAWELVGIDLCKNLASTYNINIDLKSPQAVPYVLIALVLYFGFRLIIEWNQSDTVRRGWASSRVDSLMAHFLGLSSILLFVTQHAGGQRAADLARYDLLANWMYWVLFVAMGGLGIILRVAFQRWDRLKRMKLSYALGIVLGLACLFLACIVAVVLDVYFITVNIVVFLLVVVALVCGLMLTECAIWFTPRIKSLATEAATAYARFARAPAKNGADEGKGSRR